MVAQWGGISCQFFRQVAALFPDMFCNFYLVKNHKIAKKNSTTIKASTKISTYLESLEFYNFFGVCLTKFKSNQILFNKISHRFLLTTKLFTRWKSLIETGKVIHNAVTFRRMAIRRMTSWQNPTVPEFH